MLGKARNKASEQWTAQMTVLKELVQHHVKEEESTGFSCARREFETEELEAKMNRSTPVTRAASRRCSVPSTFVS